MAGQDTAVVGHANPFLRLKNNGPCPIAKQNAGGAVLPIENAGKCFSTDHQNAFGLSGL